MSSRSSSPHTYSETYPRRSERIAARAERFANYAAKVVENTSNEPTREEYKKLYEEMQNKYKLLETQYETIINVQRKSIEVQLKLKEDCDKLNSQLILITTEKNKKIDELENHIQSLTDKVKILDEECFGFKLQKVNDTFQINELIDTVTLQQNKLNILESVRRNQLKRAIADIYPSSPSTGEEDDEEDSSYNTEDALLSQTDDDEEDILSHISELDYSNREELASEEFALENKMKDLPKEQHIICSVNINVMLAIAIYLLLIHLYLNM